ncbi:hypothetical protein GCM10010401_14170 [Rarobacter faecitabidus]|uniref:Prohead serine protease domain-containing protein n=1 Tax=Rarobacter faecitabidus TaxID=13243 RepID=A0A542ZDW8_RARFA|nr:HK97 family phage prohead protease [Rarobacter faecitabidus]TQL58536.1 hypothetical protein FB461_1951 [Rarobacter faecitabidus]
MDHETLLREAGERRAACVAAPPDRPSKRRCAENSDSGAFAPAPTRGLQLRETGDGTGLHFSGYASVYERGYEMWDFYGPYTEIVAAGAAANSLARADLDVPLVLQHDSLRRIARTTNGTLALAEDEIGLRVEAPALDAADPDVAYIAPKLRSGLIDEMSFKFRIVRGQWSPDYTEYRITEVDIHRGDVAIVAYGANPYTVGAGLRAADVRELVRGVDDATALTILADLQARSATPSPRVTSDDVRVLPFI